ncbi:folate family ECF transporter S component [Fusibacter paucivorans]|uniref:Folate family ECF transporter S component n=2 Tax=Fusibacter paucivorans TaxID=76009 RepID=A0ABS5PPM4_9FIRM|nr:folate family ECF transporter S component [Fusibacter paucivorans]
MGVKWSTNVMVTLSVLVAMEIVLSRFLSFSVWNMKIGLSFIPVVIAATALGPIYAGIVGALGDFIGAILFPIGAYFPGFTLTAFLVGMTFGLCLYHRQTLWRSFVAVSINQLVFGLFVNTYWISLLYGAPFQGLLPARLLQVLLMVPIQIIVIMPVSKASERVLERRAAA